MTCHRRQTAIRTAAPRRGGTDDTTDRSPLPGRGAGTRQRVDRTRPVRYGPEAGRATGPRRRGRQDPRKTRARMTDIDRDGETRTVSW